MKRFISIAMSLLMLMSIAPLSLASPVKDAAFDAVLNGEGAAFEYVNDTENPWTVTDVEGVQYVRSNINGVGNGLTAFSASGSLNAGTVISFDYIVSTENRFDKFTFGYITEAEPEGVVLTELSGEKEGTFSYLITETNLYNFAWVYEKDASVDNGRDTVFIRNVTLTQAPAPTSINIVEGTMTIIPGVRRKLNVTFEPEGSFATLDWESSNSEVVSVEDGVITGIAPGTAVITASYGNLSDSMEFNVVAAEGNKYIEGIRTFSENGYQVGRIRNYVLSDGSNVVIDLPFDLDPRNVTAAELVDGVLYVVASEILYAVDYETGEAVNLGGCGSVRDMTYDYVGERMLGIMSDPLTGDPYVVTIGLETGSINPLVELDIRVLTLAADRNGEVYAIELATGDLVRVDINTGITTHVLDTDIDAQFMQSMTFDLSSGLLYWAACSETIESLMEIDIAAGTITPINEDIGEIVGLHMPAVLSESVPVTGVTLSDSELNLTLGESATLTPTVQPSDATNKRVSWSSSNPAVATVENGTVRAMSEGSAVITVTTLDGNFTATCQVTVRGNYVLYEDFEDELQGWTLIDADGDNYGWMSMRDFSGGEIEAYEGSDMYTSQSFINGESPDGYDSIILFPDNWMISPEFTINADAERAVLSWISGSQDSNYPEHYSVYIGTGDATVDTFISSEPLFAGYAYRVEEKTVDLSAYAGQTVRIAFRHHVTYDCYMLNIDLIRASQVSNTASVPVTGVTLDKTSENLVVGDTLTLNATVLPENATNKNVVWTTSNEAVATVENGIVTAISAGEAVITVTTVDGAFSATCTITVTDSAVPVTGITLDIESAVMVIGGQLTINATIAPEDATNKNIVWTSSDETIATVENGVVTAIAHGEVTITATTEDGEFTATCTIKVYAMGDVTGDGIFNTGDAVVMLRKIAGLDNSTYIAELEDYNGDGQFNTGDAVAILRKIAGLA